MKRLLSLLLCLVMCFGLALAARADVTPNGEFPVVTEPITLRVFAPAIPSIVDLNTNAFTQWYEQRTGVHIEWITAPQSNYEEVMNLMLAGGDLPDIFLGTGMRPEIEEMYGPTEKMLIPLDDLIDQYAPNLKAVLESRPEILNFITATDGHIYGLPSIQDCYHCTYSQKMWINQDWLDKLGLKTPETADEFYDVLVAFRDQDPNGNGLKDEIPLVAAKETEGWFQSATGFILNAFVYDSGVYNQVKDYETKDGKVDTSVNKDGYREGLRFMNKLYTEGLLYPDSFTMTGDSMKAIALNEVELVGAAPAGHLAMFLDVATDPERYRHYAALAPLAGPDGTRHASYFPYFPIEQGEFSITSANQHPEASMRWADDFYSYTTGMRRSWGEEGVAWRVAEPGEVGLDGVTPALFKTLIPFDEQAQNDHWSWLGIEYVDNELWNGINVTTPDMDLYSPEGFEKLLWIETEEKYEPYKPTEATELIKLRLDADATDELAMLQVQLKNYIEASRADFTIGNLSLDTDWDAYIATLNDLGLPRYLELKQAALDKLHEAQD